MKKIAVFGLVFVVLFVSGCTQKQQYTCPDGSIVTDSTLCPEEVIITRIIDGDTFELENGEIVRVLGIDYPDITKEGIGKWTDMGINESRIVACYYEGIKRLENSLLNNKVNLTRDSNEQDRDQYNRLLRYVTINNADMGVVLISSGYAVMYDPTQPECDRCDYYQNITNEVKTKQLDNCLWGK